MVHFVNMPFASLTHPNLPLGLFKSQLAEAGIESEVFNFNLDFAQRIGYGGYETIAFFKGDAFKENDPTEYLKKWIEKKGSLK